MKNLTIKHELNDKQTHQLLKLLHKTWWGKDRTIEEVKTVLRNCISFALIENDSENLIGYARVLTDEIKYAFIFDVMIDEQYRGQGLSDIIMKAILAHPKLLQIKNFELTCVPELVGFYERFGFKEDYGNVKAMRYSRTPITNKEKVK